MHEVIYTEKKYEKLYIRALDIVYKEKHITKVRSRQAVKLPAVQPVVMATAHWAALLGRKNEKTIFCFDYCIICKYVYFFTAITIQPLHIF